MPQIPLEEFDSPPEIGDKVKVVGKVERIDEETDEVYVSYDKVEIINENKKKRKRRDYEDDDDEDDVVVRDDITVDEALARSFPASQPQGPGAFQA